MSLNDFRQTMRDRATKAADAITDGKNTNAIAIAQDQQKAIAGLFQEFSQLIGSGKPTGMTYAGELIPAYEVEDFTFGITRSAGAWLVIGQFGGAQANVLLSNADAEANDLSIAGLLSVLSPDPF